MRKKRLLARTGVLSLMLLLCLYASPQNKLISGKVTDSKDGSPLQGVSVVPEGSKKGAVTDANGDFSISVGSKTGSLVFSFVGYVTQQSKVSGNNVSISLTSNSDALNEIVVIGYGTTKKKELTGSIATVSEKDFQQGSITTPEQLIAGKVSGVSITSNGGAPGDGSTIRIRGGASLNASNDPLIVVDGIPLSPNGIPGAAAPLALINPNDIESFTILKDAASCAIYGSRASNGVIMITTKRGKKGKPVINFNTGLSVSKLPKEYPVLSSGQFRSLINSVGTPAQIAMMGTANTDWQKQIYQSALSTDNNLSVSGSFNNIPYRISGEYLNMEGILKTGSLQREALGINLNPHLLNDHLKIDINFHGAINDTRFANQSAIPAAITMDPTQSVYNSKSPFGGYFEWMNNDTTPNSLAGRNPVALLQQNQNKGTAKRAIGNIQIDYKFHFLPDLHANVNLGIDAAKGYGSTYIPVNAAQAYNQYDSLRGENNPYKTTLFNKVGEFYLTYVKDIKSIKSNINAVAGYGYYDNYTITYNYSQFSATNNVQPQTQQQFAETPADVTLLSYYGRLIYTYNDKYILMGSIRTDGSSRFDAQNRWGTFPSAAFTWKISQEKFLKYSNTLSDLKLRASYGITGQQEGIGYYGYIPYNVLSLNVAQVNFGSDFYKFWSPQPFVTDLKWEQTASSDIGLDYGFLNNRISGGIDYYYKKTKDLLGTVFIPVGTNFGNQVTRNVGNMTDQGVDFDIKVTPIRTNDIKWDVSFNVSYNKYVITNLTVAQDSLAKLVNDPVGGISGGTGNNIQVHSVGYAPFSFYVLQQIYGANGKPIEGLYVDQNRDGIINNSDLIHYKSPFPKFVFGFSTSLNYKKWDFNTTLRANLGNYMYNNVASNFATVRNVLNPAGFLSNAPSSLLNTMFLNNQYFSDYYVENASFLRMDNIGIGYNVGRLPASKITSLRLGLNCQNVFVITKYSGTDPEIYGGIDNNFYPRPRTYTFSLSLGF